MNLSKFSIHHSRVTLFLAIFISIAGIFLYLDYPKQEDPSITVREAIVTTQFSGMSPQRIEYLITRPLEEKIREIAEVDTITSESKLGTSIIHVQIRDEVSNLPDVWEKLRNKVNDVKASLPDGSQGPWVNDEFGLTAIATVALLSDGFSLAEMREEARDIRDNLYTLEGIKRVELYGIQEERIFIELENSKIAELGISPIAIKQALQQQNVLLTGGSVNITGRNFAIEPTGNFNNIEQISSLLLRIPNTDQSLELRDIAQIRREYVSPLENPVYFNGQQAVILSISVLDATDAVAFGNRLKQRVKALENQLSIGYSLQFATFQPDLIDKAVNGAVINLGQTIVIVIVLVVVMLFLGVRTGLIVGSFVPMVMLFGMLMMSMFGIELQRISIASMIIALGMLVDNGIVVVQDIQTRMRSGTEKKAAALETGRTLTIPLLTSSLTTILAFMPLMLMVGAAGEYTGSLSYVTAILMVGSWLLAMLVVPLASVWFMKVKPASSKESNYDTRFFHFYRSALHWVLGHRLIAGILVIVTLAVAVVGFAQVPKEFFPKGDRNQYLIYFDLPAGTQSDAVADQLQQLNGWLLDKQKNPEINSTISYIGQGGPRFYSALAPVDPDSHRSFTVVSLEHSNQVKELVIRTHNHILNNYPDARGHVKSMWLGPSETGLFEIRISGQDSVILEKAAEQFMTELYALEGTIDVKHDWENPIFKLEVIIDQARARRANITSSDVAQAMNAFMDGSHVSDYREGDNVIPIIVRGSEAERDVVGNLWDLVIFSEQNTEGVSLAQVAEIRGLGQYSRIRRRDQQRTITVQAKHVKMKAAEIHQQMKPAITRLTDSIPAHYSIELGGELEGSSDAQKKLATWMPIAFMLIAALLVWQFNSFRRATVILLTIPLIIVGAVIGLLTMRAVFGFMTILGLLALAGIIINNGIVMIDRIEEERNAGTDPYDAIIAAAQSRLQPILLSVATTVLGLLPLIIYKDPLFYGMASMMAFALSVGTLLTLGVIPLLYSVLMNVKRSDESTMTY
ncbi:MAG: efflux RND transporter permease subunit [Candidatus Thiodiazotropha sp. (ex Lucinoma borealis)]|nr:efflux RND transporter permease subunit [Candidatus Thiodiazotropha sp. (ex Lucinoma borealis)]